MGDLEGEKMQEQCKSEYQPHGSFKLFCMKDEGHKGDHYHDIEGIAWNDDGKRLAELEAEVESKNLALEQMQEAWLDAKGKAFEYAKKAERLEGALREIVTLADIKDAGKAAEQALSTEDGG